MVNSCAAYNCTKRHEKGVSFHVFPKDENVRKKWVVAMRRNKWVPSESSELCSKHFLESDYDTSGWSSVRRLKKDAVPSVFDFPNHFKQQHPKRLPPKVRTLPEPKRRSLQRTCEEEALSEFLPARDEISNNHDIDEHSPTDCNHTETPIAKERKGRKHYVGDFSTNGDKALEKAKEVIMKKNKQLKIERNKVARLNKKITKLEELVAHLKEKFSTPDVAVQSLLSSVPEKCKLLFTQMLTGGQRGVQYPAELKAFAITLDFYSPKAYEYVRNTFNKCLPCRRQIQKWYQTISGNPGFNTEVIDVLKKKTELAKMKKRRVVCSLMFDEMSIRKQIDVSGEKIVGYVDFGGGCVANDEAPMAKDVLVFMINCLNDNWKVPVAYFLINSITAEEKANLVMKCLNFLSEVDLDVVSLTFDGLFSNISMCHRLGANMSVENLKPWFLHPKTGEKVFIYPDPPHMLKLVRNTIASLGVIYNKNGNPIKWDYLVKLVEIQKQEGLHLATKIRDRHIQWDSEKMRVKLAAQTFSNSVAKALQYLRETQYLGSYFVDSEATELFSSAINNGFDILNSRNKFSFGFKGGLTDKNFTTIAVEIDRIIDYVKGLQIYPDKGLLIEGRRKVGFVGLIISLTALKELYMSYVDGKANRKILDYLLSYKMSQDHLEIFFSALRSRGGNNNNPSALQFIGAYKRLLLHTDIRGSKYANCLDVSEESISILALKGPSVVAKAILPVEVSAIEAEEKFLQIMNDATILDHDYNLVMYPACSMYAADVISYMAGFVVRQLQKSVYCDPCLEALVSSEHPSYFQNLKQYNKNSSKGLIRASSDVIYLCHLGEKIFRLECSRGNFGKLNFQRLVIQALQLVGKPLFPLLDFHQREETPMGNHVLHLSKMVINNYLKIRAHHEALQVTEAAKMKGRIRSVLTKRILFYNQ